MIGLFLSALIFFFMFWLLVKSEKNRRKLAFEDFLKGNKKDLRDEFLENIQDVHGLPVWEVKDLLKKHGYEEHIVICKHVKHAVWSKN